MMGRIPCYLIMFVLFFHFDIGRVWFFRDFQVQIRKPNNGTGRSPFAKLFSEKNFTVISGQTEEYNFHTSSYRGGCHDLKTLGGKVKSVETFDSCIRLFYDLGCYGWSLAVYPRSPNSHNVLNAKLTQVYSIGPCLKDEMEKGHRTGSTREARKNYSCNIPKYVPDLVEFFSWQKYTEATRVGNSPFSLTHYKLGPTDRLEFVRAVVDTKHVNDSQSNVHVNLDFSKPSEKIQALAIPASIGGPAGAAYNVIPQSYSAQWELSGLAEKIRVFLTHGSNSDKKWVYFYLNFMYNDDQQDKIPYAFYYIVYYYNEEIQYGRIIN